MSTRPISRQSMLRVREPQSGLRARSAEKFGDDVDQKPTMQDQILSTADAYREAGRSSGRTDTRRDLAQVQANERNGTGAENLKSA